MMKMKRALDYRRWPGKARPSSVSGQPWHPVAFHMLDVSACAERLLHVGATRFARLAASVELDPVALKRAMLVLVALHDVGKFSRAFAAQIGCGEPPGLDVAGATSGKSHWRISFGLLVGPLDETLALVVGGNERVRRHLYAAVSGHHGRPPLDDDRQLGDPVGAESARAFVADLIALFPGGCASIEKPETAKRLSWTLAGLTTTADWLGSNAEWFPYADWNQPLSAYWSIAQERAEHALREAGAVGAELAPAQGVGSLFDIDVPRPMQVEAETVALPKGPVLAVIEDLTGSGKTEAAIVLAHRMMVAKKGMGLYVALPTMATANAMFERVGQAYRRLYRAGTKPSLALAHGRRNLNEGFRLAVRAPGAPSEGVDLSVAAACAEWIADDRRKTSRLISSGAMPSRWHAIALAVPRPLFADSE